MVDPSNDLWVEEEGLHLRLVVEVDHKVINNGKEEVVVGGLSNNGHHNSNKGLHNSSKEDLHEMRLQAIGAISAPRNSRDLPNSSKGTDVAAAVRSNDLHSKAEDTGAAVVAHRSKTSTAGEEGRDKIRINSNISRRRVGRRGTTAGAIRTASKEVDIRSKGAAIKIEAGSRAVDRKIAGTAGDMVPETMVAWIKKTDTKKALANR